MDFRAQWAKDVGKTVAEAVAKCQRPVMEPKYDGWRCIVIRDEAGVHIWNPSRNSDPSKNYDGQLPELEADLMKLPVGTILDGELVALTYEVDEARWVNDFYRIHSVMRGKDVAGLVAQREGIKLVAFDCPVPNIATKTLPERREYIAALIESCDLQMAELTTQQEATQENWDALVAMGFEGTVVKDEAKPYGFAKRGHGWFKVKNTRTIDCVVMDVLFDGKGRNAGLVGRMVVGQWKLRESGSGLTDLVEVAKVNCLNDKQRADCTAYPNKYVGQVIEVKIYGWDKDGPRHPTPLRFREDKRSDECILSKV